MDGKIQRKQLLAAASARYTRLSYSADFYKFDFFGFVWLIKTGHGSGWAAFGREKGITSSSFDV